MNPITPHNHNDTDSPKLYAGDCLLNAPQEALTTGTVDVAGATYTAVEQAMLDNVVLRLAELEAKLQTLGILK